MGELVIDQSTSAPNTFVGRERELAELVSACESGAVAGTHLFLISGEPGIGKTRLADEVALRAKARGMQVLWGRCWEGGGAPAYWPWIQIIRSFLSALDSERRHLALESEIAADIITQVSQIVPELRSTQSSFRPPVIGKLEPREARFRLFDAVTNFLKIGARSGPMLIVLDDLHEADEASLALLRFFVAELKATPILVIATYRDAEVECSRALSAQVGVISRNARSIPMRGLSESEVRRFVEVAAGREPQEKLVSRLTEATNGNPLFLEGIVRILVAENAVGASDAAQSRFKIPVGVREAILRQLDRLTKESRELLEVGAAVGKEFALDICSGVAEVSEGDARGQLEDAVRAGILNEFERGRYRFAHALIRETVYEDLNSDTRISLHRVIANRLEEKYQTEIEAHTAELANHCRAAGVDDKAVEYFRRAARAALRVYSHADGVAYLRAALALTTGQNDFRRADLLLLLGKILALYFDQSEGIANLEAALEIFRILKNDQRIAKANAALGHALSIASLGTTASANFPRALGHLREAIAWKGEWTGRTDLGNVNYGLATSLFQMDQNQEAMLAAERARDEYKRHHNPAWIIAESWRARSLTVKGRHREAAALLEEVAGIAYQTQNAEVFRAVMGDTGWCRVTLRDPIEAKRYYLMGMERKGFAEIQRDQHFWFLANSEILTGNLSRAKLIVSEHNVPPTCRAGIAFREGDWDAATEIYRAMLEYARRVGNRFEELASLWSLSENFRVAGNLQQANEYLAQSFRAYDTGDLLWEMRFRPEAAMLAVEMSQLDVALQHLRLCRAIVAKGEEWSGWAAPAERAEGILAAAQGREYAAHFERSVSVAKRYSLPWTEADTLHDWGVALSRDGKPAQAIGKFDGAIEIYRCHGAGQRWIDRVEAARHSFATRGKSSESKPASPVGEIFQREGEFWTISYEGRTIRLKDAKGLHYIAYLLSKSGQRIHVLDLIEAVEGATLSRPTTIHPESEGLNIVRELGGSTQSIDSRARAEYRTRLRDLHTDLDEAERMNDLGRCERVRTEIEMVGQQLTESSGLRGSARAASSSAERARGVVRKNVGSVLEKIRRESPDLGRHLAAALRLGYFCVYQFERPVSWHF